MRRCRLFILIFAMFVALAGVGASAPAHAQVIKPYGMPIPSFFFSAGERRARDACADNRPECRASVRAQMEQEMAISLVIPWVILAIGILIVLFYLREQERKKAKAAGIARSHHDPGAFRKLDREPRTKGNNADDDDVEDLS